MKMSLRRSGIEPAYKFTDIFLCMENLVDFRIKV